MAIWALSHTLGNFQLYAVPNGVGVWGRCDES